MKHYHWRTTCRCFIRRRRWQFRFRPSLGRPQTRRRGRSLSEEVLASRLTNGNDAEEGISKEITEFDAVKLLIPTELYSKNSVGMFELSTLCYFNFEMSKIEIGSTIPLMFSIIFFTRVLDHSGCTIQNFLPDRSVPLTNPSLKVAV